MTANKQQIYEHLAAIKDPEIPVLDIIEMGIIRDVEIDNDNICIVITPTYSGCPAMYPIKEEIISTLNKQGYENVKIRTIFSPPWTTDWLTEETKQKLKEYGIAPPEKTNHLTGVFEHPNASCPFCDSGNTEKKSEFGSTPCKAMHYCNNCHQPFEYFKCI